MATSNPEIGYEDNVTDVCYAERASENITKDGEYELTLSDKMRAAPRVLKYMIPFGLVYLFEYFINQGLVSDSFKFRKCSRAFEVAESNFEVLKKKMRKSDMRCFSIDGRLSNDANGFAEGPIAS